MATLAAFTGFEYGTPKGVGGGTVGAQVWDGITGTADTDVKVVSGTPTGGAGDYVGEINLTAKNYFWNTNTIGTSKTVLVVSMRFRLTTLPSGDTDIISMDTAASTDRAGFFYKQSTGKLHAWIAATNQASAATISVNTWYTLQWKFDVTGTQTLDWSLDGVAGTQVSNGAASTIARVAFGNRGAGTGVAQYDGCAISTTSGDHPLPIYNVPAALKVDPAGTVTLSGTSANFDTFTGNGTLAGGWNATTARDNIDELPPTIGASADGFVQITNAAGDYVQIPMTTYTLGGGETIAGVRMVACGWATSGTAAALGFRSWNGTTETTLVDAATVIDAGYDNSTTAPGWTGKLLTLADVNTQGELDALEFRVGFSGDTNPDCGIHAIYAEVAVEVGSAITLTVADAAQAQATDAVALTQVHTLVIADATQAQSTDAVALTQVHALTVADATQAQSTDGVALTQVHALAVADATQAQSTDPVALTQAHTLTVADAAQAQAVGSPTLTQAYVLAVADALQAQATDPVVLTQAHQLAVQDALMAQLADTVIFGGTRPGGLLTAGGRPAAALTASGRPGGTLEAS